VELDAPMVSFEAGAAPQDGRLKPYWTEYQINDAGFRGQDISKTKPSGTQRVLCLGDSFTFGQGVKAGDTYAEQLQKILCSPTAPGRKVEVINAGRCGYSTREELVVLQKEGLAFDPDLVILQLSDNDVQDHLRNHRSPQVNEAVHTYAEIVDTVIELIRAAESHDTRVLVFLFRINAMYRGWYTLQEELKRIPSHVPVVDLGREVEPTLGLFAENYWLYCVHPIDQHPNERAHYWAARVLASAIDREQLLQRASE
jgi:lysophospholipase L1-like esterase